MLYSIISSLFLIGAYSQAPPVDAVPVDPVPIDPVPVDPIPVDPIPVDPVAVDPVAVDPVPVDPAPVDPIPVDPVPVDPAQQAAPVDPVPVNPIPVDPVPVDPVPVDPIPVDPVPVDPVPGTGNPGPNVVTPEPPINSNPNPITPQQPPVTPQRPPATPQYGYPQQPPYNPYNPGFMGLLDPQVLKCEMGQCRNRAITMSPGQGFKLECNMPRQCDGLALTLNVGVDPTNFGSQVNEINDFNFDAPQNGVTITINNPMMQNIEVNNINCKRPLSCQNMRVLAGVGVELWEVNVKCEMPGACPGCTINGQSCEMISMMTGNGHGGIAPGFGYMNQPNFGQPQTGFGAPAPQQPGVGAPAPPQPQPQQYYPQYPQYPQYGYPQYQQPQFYPMYNPWI